jgi:ABC-type glutathione transport system ATPase component
MSAILEAVNVSKVYIRRGGVLRRNIGEIRAVDGVSLTVGEGERVGLLGESGCGKTTLAKLLVGLIQPTTGDVRIQGTRLSGARGPRLLELRRAVQFIFQDPMNSLNPRMTVEEILQEPLIVHRAGAGPDRAKRVRSLLDAVQLPDAHRRRLARQLSGGERQRVGIARALALDPKAVICDEPIAALDVSVGAQILQLLSELSERRGMALLFISHDLRAVAWLCGRIAVMRQGRIVESAPTGQILVNPQQTYTATLIRSAQLDLDSTPDLTQK